MDTLRPDDLRSVLEHDRVPTGVLGPHVRRRNPVTIVGAATRRVHFGQVAAVLYPLRVAVRIGRRRDGAEDADTDGEADAFVQRQDGWAFGAKGVVSLMAGGSFSDMALLQAFLGSNYHGPADQPGQPYPLGGAAEDADLHVALARAFGSIKRWAGK